jgi:hypothetical protein
MKDGIFFDGYQIVHPNRFLEKKIDGLVLICSQSDQTSKNFSEYLKVRKLVLRDNFIVVSHIF